MLYAHGPDLCHEADMRHAMANAFEAVCGECCGAASAQNSRIALRIVNGQSKVMGI